MKPIQILVLLLFLLSLFFLVVCYQSHASEMEKYSFIVKYEVIAEWIVKARDYEEAEQMLEEWNFVEEDVIDLQDLEIVEQNQVKP